MNQYPPLFGTGNGTANEDQTLLNINSVNRQVLLGNALGTHVTSHLLTFEDAARILTLTG